MTDQKTVEHSLLSLSDVTKEYPFDKKTAVYKIGDEMFALLVEGSKPLRLSLRCEPQLAGVLREKYETIMPGHNLDKNLWNTIILTGQLPGEEVGGLIRHSYEIASAKHSKKPLGG